MCEIVQKIVEKLMMDEEGETFLVRIKWDSNRRDGTHSLLLCASKGILPWEQ
jgi:hypothetical protein